MVQLAAQGFMVAGVFHGDPRFSKIRVEDLSQLVNDKVKIDEDAFKQDLAFIKAMIRFEIDTALFGAADAWRHMIGVDPQAQVALSEFGEAQKLLDLGRASGSKAH